MNPKILFFVIKTLNKHAIIERTTDGISIVYY